MPVIIDLNNIKPISLEQIEKDKEPNTTFNTEIIEKKETPKIEKIKIPKKKVKKEIDINMELNPNNNLLLTIKEAETLSGISTISIRKAIKSKEIDYTLDDGKYKIDFNNLIKWCYSSTRRKNVFNTVGIGKYVNSWKTTI